MAAIDKIYGNRKQYNKLYSWIKKNHPTWLIYFYPKPKRKSIKLFAMTNFPCDVDRYLLNYCPLDFVIKAIKQSYGLDREIY